MTSEQMLDQLRRDEMKLYSIARGMMGNHHDALDMVQETAFKACRKAWSLRDEGAVSGFLCAVLVNCCRSALRRRHAWVELCPDQASVPDETGSVDLRQMVESLPHAQRELVLLRFYADMTHAQIAARLHMPESTVRHRLKRTLQALRMQWEEDGQ